MAQGSPDGFTAEDKHLKMPQVEDITTTLVEWAGRDEEKQLRTTLRAQACGT
jgi:hypothetical protein